VDRFGQPSEVVSAEVVERQARSASGSYGVGPTPRVLATTLFTDIVSSTELLRAHGDAHWRHRLEIHDDIVDNLLTKSGGRNAKHTGDGVFALFDSPTNAAHCGLELIATLATRGLRIRAGIHTGECERRGDEWSGLAIHIGARLSETANPSEVIAHPGSLPPHRSRCPPKLLGPNGNRSHSVHSDRNSGKSDGGDVDRTLRSSSVIRSMSGRIRSTARDVKALATSLRSLVWSGGSVISMVALTEKVCAPPVPDGNSARTRS
jgi:Adenylate and Guanylate cyclase catalytic domain